MGRSTEERAWNIEERGLGRWLGTLDSSLGGIGVC